MRGVEVISVREQALAEVRRTPIDFVVPALRDKGAWERAQTFFQLYLGGGKPADVSVGESLITNGGSRRAKYVYEVERNPEREGIHYSVRCTPHGAAADHSAARLNAQNLARFIKDGTLERSLLDE